MNPDKSNQKINKSVRLAAINIITRLFRKKKSIHVCMEAQSGTGKSNFCNKLLKSGK